MTKDLLKAVEASDVSEVSQQFKFQHLTGTEAWEIHHALFPIVQRVQNPPFINPHLPKMYRICGEFLPYLKEDDLAPLVRLEITEYTRRPKLEKIPKAGPGTSSVSFKKIESAIQDRDREKAAALMATFISQKGETEFARRLLLLGSGYLDASLGHSVSCTAFILLEMMERKDQDPWPAIATLADYFCGGKFSATPVLRKPGVFSPEEAVKHHLLRATSGQGIINLHHTITIYAMERVRQFFSPEEYPHMVGAWIAFMGNKRSEETTVKGIEKPAADYPDFFKLFSALETKPVLEWTRGSMGSPQGRQQLGRFLIKGLCDQYHGNYNPHYLTGLGSALWVVERYWNQPPIALNALSQYLNFFFDGVRS